MEEDIEELSWLTAGKRATEAPLLSLLVRKELTPWGGGQTLGSMVTECVINAAMCPASSPQDLLNLRTLSQSLEERERSAGGEGRIRAPLMPLHLSREGI